MWKEVLYMKVPLMKYYIISNNNSKIGLYNMSKI